MYFYAPIDSNDMSPFQILPELKKEKQADLVQISKYLV